MPVYMTGSHDRMSQRDFVQLRCCDPKGSSESLCRTALLDVEKAEDGVGAGGGDGWGQIWSSMGKTRRVPRLSSSCSRESSSRSSASSDVLPLLFPFALQPDPPAVSAPLPDAPLAVMAVSPKVKVKSASPRIRSESGSLSCSWF